MNKKILTILNTGISIDEFEDNYYICPNNKNYTFKTSPNYLAGHYKKEVKYIAKIRARGIVKLIGNEFVVIEKRGNLADKDIINRLLIEVCKKDQAMGVIDREKESRAEGNQVFLLEDVKEINASYTPGFTHFSKLYVNLISSQEITFDIVATKLRNKDLNIYDFSCVNLDEM
jgi:hypothetical protein